MLRKTLPSAEPITQFWDRDANERAALMQRVNGEAENFYDLPPDERASVYESDE